MEDALALQEKKYTSTVALPVLILVLMEDALARLRTQKYLLHKRRLNPCFNGRCTRTVQSKEAYKASNSVLILVLMP